jgi:tetratricopeptide (TPR) repeat protein
MPIDFPALPDSPFRGLDAFSEDDRDYFFGREEDATTIGANVLTAPLTVVYGASGVGKSSTVMAGVIPILRAQRNVTIILFRSWQQPDLISALNQSVDEAVFARVGQHADTSGGFDLCVASAVASTNAPVVILFDQFEEFLLYHAAPSENGAAFDVQFARLVNRPDAPVSFLISIREDWLARLDRFQRHIPNLLSNVIRLKHLDYDGARRATTKPIDHYNDVLRREDKTAKPYMIESELVDVVLGQVTTASGLRAGEVTGAYTSVEDGARIETPFLQMILVELWKAEQSEGSHLLRASTLDRLGGAAHIVHSYVSRVVSQLSRDQQEICARMFDRLVTPSASKIAHSAQDLAEFARVSPAAIMAVLKPLTINRILRQVVSPSVTCYEIFHDVLARPILQWRTGYLRARRGAVAKRRLAGVSIATAVLISVAAGLSIHHLTMERQHDEADHLLIQARDPNKTEGAAFKFIQAFQLYSANKDDKAELSAVDEAVITAASRLKGKDALHMYEVATKVAQTPTRVIRAWTQVGRLKFEQNDTAGARVAAQQATNYANALKQKSPRSWFRIGELQMRIGDRKQALEAFQNALAQSEETNDIDIEADSYYNTGLLRYQDGHLQEAITSLEKAADLQRRSDGRDVPSTLNVLTYLYRQLGNKEEADRQQEAAAAALAKVLRAGVSINAEAQLTPQAQ